MAKKLVVTVGRDGKTSIEAVGFEGQGCEAAVADFATKLSAQPVGQPEYKPEYNAVVNEETNLQ
jgi:hypothetical protein